MKFFNGIRLYLQDQSTGLLKMKFVCEKCGVEMESPDGYFIHCSPSGILKVHEIEFYCQKCYEERQQQWRRGKQND